MPMQDSHAIDPIFDQRSPAARPKRAGDFLIAWTLLVITLPLLLIVALAIKVDSPGPVLENRACIGLRGRRFRMLQFRTVVWEPRYFVPPWAREPTGMAQFLRVPVSRGSRGSSMCFVAKWHHRSRGGFTLFPRLAGPQAVPRVGRSPSALALNSGDIRACGGLLGRHAVGNLTVSASALAAGR